MGEIADALNRAEKRRDSSGRGSSLVAHTNTHNARLATPLPNLIEPTTSARPSEDSTVQAEAEAETGAPHYHAIPRDRRAGWQRRVCAVDPESPTAVRFRHLAIKVRALLENGTRRSVLVTSALSNEGKTTVSINLAMALASIAPDSRIALVDFDLKKGSVSRALEYRPSVGVERVLSGDLSLDSVRVTTDIPSLDFYPVLNLVTSSHGLLGSAVEDVLHQLSTRYDFVICDGPPGLLVPDVALIAPHVGGCLAVSRSGMTRHSTFKELISLLPPSSIFGVFLNDCVLPNGGDKYRYYVAANDPDREVTEGNEQ